MKEVVLDSSVVLKWFRARGERHAGAAEALRGEFQAGRLAVVVPPLLDLEVLNVAARAWAWRKPKLIGLTTAMERAGFDRRTPELERVADWAARGLTAYDAVYVALAEEEGIELITDDDLIVHIAGAVRLAAAP